MTVPEGRGAFFRYVLRIHMLPGPDCHHEKKKKKRKYISQSDSCILVCPDTKAPPCLKEQLPPCASACGLQVHKRDDTIGPMVLE